jgi:osmoprotectant transport system ATP-binding protein
MGTRIAIMRAGRLIQYDTPQAILARPADAFVEAFVGSDRALKRLSLLVVSDHATQNAAAAGAPRVAQSLNLRDALSTLLSADADVATVVDASGEIRGTLTLDAIRAAFDLTAEERR